MTRFQERTFRTYRRDNVNDARWARARKRLAEIEAELSRIHAKHIGDDCDEVSLPVGLSSHIALLQREREMLLVDA